jgi:hypothetical protein
MATKIDVDIYCSVDAYVQRTYIEQTSTTPRALFNTENPFLKELKSAHKTALAPRIPEIHIYMLYYMGEI